MSYLKTQAIRSNHIRKAARGEACTVQLPCCNGGGETTVLAHLPDESHGMGRKSDDLSAVFCCSACHDAIDGRGTGRVTQNELDAAREWYLRRALIRTWRRLYELELIAIKGAA